MIKEGIRILRENAGIVLCGLAIEIVLLSLFLQPQLEAMSGRWVIASALSANGEPAPAQLLLSLIPYWFAYRIMRDKRRRGDAALVIAFSCLFAVTLLAHVIPMSSHDLFLYAFFGHVYRDFGAHPYDAIAAAIADATYVGAMGNGLASVQNTYGPLWTGIATVATAVAGRGLAVNAFAFKLVASAFFFATAYLLSRLGSCPAGTLRWDERAERSVATFGLFAWNPVLLFEFVQNGHNDVAMLFFLVLAFFFAAKRLPVATGAALAASVSIKYVTALCVPFFILYFLFGASTTPLRRRFRDATVLVVAFATLVALFFLPYWRGAETLDGLRARAEYFALANLGPVPYLLSMIAGKGSLDSNVYKPITESIKFACNILLLGALLAAFVVACRRCLPTSLKLRAASRLRDVAVFSAIVIGSYLAIATFWVMPWYLLWLAPLFILLGKHPELLLCSALALLAYGYNTGDVLLFGIIGLAAIVWVRRSRAAGTLPARLAVFFDEPSTVRS